MPERCLRRGGGAVRASREQAFARRNPALPRISGAGTGNSAAPRLAGVGEDRLGRLPGNFETTQANRVARRLSFFPRRRMQVRGRFASALRRLSSEPAKHADRAAHGSHVLACAKAHSRISLSSLRVLWLSLYRVPPLPIRL